MAAVRVVCSPTSKRQLDCAKTKQFWQVEGPHGEAEVEATRLKEQEEHRRAAIIEEERQRLLKMYAKKYKDFLPKGVLLSESDLALLAD